MGKGVNRGEVSGTFFREHIDEAGRLLRFARNIRLVAGHCEGARATAAIPRIRKRKRSEGCERWEKVSGTSLLTEASSSWKNAKEAPDTFFREQRK